MIKYDIYAFISYDHNGPYAEWEMYAADEGAGRFVLAADALAEIERLRELAREFAAEAAILAEELGYTHSAKHLSEKAREYTKGFDQ